MMQPKSRKERVAEYGSFLYCPKKDTICSALDNDDGICRKTLCYLDDLEYINMRNRIEKNIAENARREREERDKENHSPHAPIRRQTKTSAQHLKEQIERKEEKARRLYQANKPKAAEIVMREVMMLRGRLRKMKGA